MRILFCGISGIPNVSSAPINRYLAIAQAMSLDNEIIMLNRIPLSIKDPLIKKDIYCNFRIIDSTKIQYRPKSFLKRNFLKVASFIYEYQTIKKLNNEKKIDFLNVYTQYFSLCLFYFFLSKLFHFKIIIHYVEFRSKINGRSLFFRINDRLFDKYAVHLCDKLIPISNLINSHILRLKPTAETLIVPPICDFSYIESIIPESADKKYFVFCGSSSYQDIILFITESFLKIRFPNETTLHLVINGDITNQPLKRLLESNEARILTFRNLRYDTLIAKYKGALAQLIPLRNSIQDCSRFPQKICEYLASKRPIVTTGFGEINHYFFDGQNAIVASEFDINCYTEKLEWIINNPEKLSTISQNSYRTGYNYFDIHNYKPKLLNFLAI